MGNFDHVDVSDIRWKRHSDSELYLDKFETKQEAMQYVKKLAERYRATPAWQNTITDLVEEARAEGVVLYVKHLSKWFQEVFNLTVQRGSRSEKDKEVMTLYIWKTLNNRLKNLVKKGDMTLHKRSWFCNLILSIHMGIPVEELVVYFDDHVEVDGAVIEKVPVVFYFENDKEIRALNIFSPPKQTQRLIEDWCVIGDMKLIRERAIRHGLQTLGANYG